MRQITEAVPIATLPELHDLLRVLPVLLASSQDLRLALAGQLPALAAGLVRGASPAHSLSPAQVDTALTQALAAVGDSVLALVLDDSEAVRRAGVDCAVAAAWEITTAAADLLSLSRPTSSRASASPPLSSLAAPLLARECPSSFARLLGTLVHMVLAVSSHPNDRYSCSSPRLAAGLLPLCVCPPSSATAAAAPSIVEVASGSPPPLAPGAAFTALLAHLSAQVRVAMDGENQGQGG